MVGKSPDVIASIQMKPRILLVPDWLSWITGTEAKAIQAHHPQLNCDVIPASALRYAIAQGWEPEKHFQIVHLMTTEVAREFGPRFLGKVPTVTSMHHIHDDNDLVADTSGDAIMTVSSPWEQELQRRGIPKEKMVRVANGVDTNLFRPPSGEERKKVRRKLGIKNEEVVIGFVGKKGSDNFGRKGFDIFCEGLILLQKLGLPCVALVQGSGWQRELTERLKAEVRFIHIPYASDPSIVYRAMDFYWVASRIEGGPVPLLEAMASGVPCICRKVGMVEDVISGNEAGVVLKDGTSEQFANETQKVWADQSRYRKISGSARETVVKKFGWQMTVEAAPLLYRAAYELFSRKYGNGLFVDIQERSNLNTAKVIDLQNVSVMESLPSDIRMVCLYQERMQMVKELFRVRNRWAASRIALFVWAKHPEQSVAIAGELIQGWLSDVRMVLGRWKGHIRAVLRKVLATKTAQGGKLL